MATKTTLFRTAPSNSSWTLLSPHTAIRALTSQSDHNAPLLVLILHPATDGTHGMLVIMYIDIYIYNYMLQHGLSPPPLPWWLVGVMFVVRPLRFPSIRSLGGSSLQVCNSVWSQQFRSTVYPFFLAGLLQPQQSRQLIRLEAYSIFPPDQSQPTVNLFFLAGLLQPSTVY